jgi:hypothetical protein
MDPILGCSDNPEGLNYWVLAYSVWFSRLQAG